MNCEELLCTADRLEPKELVAWEGRFDEAERVMGTEAANALRKLYDYYGKDFLVWLAKLYDPNTGCFYYSNSARDNEGFLPDCESTAQTLYMFRFAGLLSRYNRDFSKAFPEKMVSKCLEYLKSLQSPEDGYFYHPQWGDRISVSRRGRDFAQCTEIIAEMGGKPTYPTATERLSATTAGDTEARTEMPKHLRSKEDMKEWLDDLKYRCTDQDSGMFNSYSFGHILSSAAQGGQLLSSGLGDFVCDYLDELQDPETGFWEKGATYNSVSGVIKIGGVYSGIPGRIMKHAEKIIESCIDVILSDEETLHMCLVFNPNGALSTAIKALIKANDEFEKRGEPAPYDIAAMRRVIYEKFPAIVDKTIEKLEKFRLPDGSFSYFQAHCAAITQNVSVAKRCKEGDVNATICAILYLLGGVFGYLGIPVVPMANAADFEIIRGIISDAEPAKKIPCEVPYQYSEDFLNYGMDCRSELVGKHRASIGNDPLRPNNKVCFWTVERGEHSSYAFNGKAHLDPPREIGCFEFECELLIPDLPVIGEAYKLTLETDGDRAAYSASLSAQNGSVIFSDTDGDALLGRVGEWIRLTCLYYPDESFARVEIYLNGECIRNSDTCLEVGTEPFGYVTKGKFTKVCDEKLTICFDNFKTRLHIGKPITN